MTRGLRKGAVDIDGVRREREAESESSSVYQFETEFKKIKFYAR